MKNFIRNLSIQNKILFVFIIMTLIISLTVITILPQIKHTIIEDNKAQMIQTTKLTAVMTKALFDNSIKNYLRGISETHLNTVEYFYNLYKSGKITKKEALSNIEKLLLSHKIGKSGYIVVVDISKGKKNITLAVHPKAKGANISKFQFVQNMYKEKNGYMEYKWKNKNEKNARKKAMYMSYFEPWQWIINAAPYKKEFYSLMDKKEFRNSLQEVNGLKTDKRSINIFNIKGDVIYSSLSNYQNILSSNQMGFAKELLTKIKKNSNTEHHGWMEYNYNNQSKMIYYVYLPKYKWVVSSIVDKSVVLQSYNHLKIKLIIIMMLTLASIFILGLLVGKYLNHRINILLDASNKLANNIDFKLERQATDEIGELEDSFSGASKQIRELINKQEDLYKNLEIKVHERTKDLVETKKEIEEIHKQTRDSIEYASLIQGSVVSQETDISPYFKDSFVHWMPKDTVGGDIWLFNHLRHEDECLLLYIDCTGHGVPGAFVTMIVKAIEREVTSIINSDLYMDVSPAWIMSYFNRTMKILLKQETKDSLSNAGWDGGIIYYNRRKQILKFAGAETPLFYITADGEFKTVKGNRYSVGYKKCDINYQYKETIIEVEEGMKFYCTTDGYLDQNGGEKDFPFGKKRFSNIIKENYKLSMDQQKEVFISQMKEYESYIPNNDRNDDMTVIAFEIGAKSDIKEDTIVEILKYEGVMTQNVIATAMDNIEAKIANMGTMGIVSTIIIEYCQNMMNYSKDDKPNTRNIVPAGAIEVEFINNEYYIIVANNIVSIDDKNKLEVKLIEIQSLDKAGIKKRYRELRRSGKNTHDKGGGIGLYEIAKVSDSIEYSFKAINADKYEFTMKSIVKPKKRSI